MYTPYSLWVGVATNIILALYVAFTSKHYRKITNYEIWIIVISSVIFSWALATSIANATLSLYVIGRFGRIVLNVVLLSYIIRNKQFSIRSFINGMGIVLIINVFIVYIQLNPAWKVYFLEIAEVTKEFKGSLRSFGLYSSFDPCGLNIVIGMFFWGILLYYYRLKISLLFLLLTFASSIFVSRTTMIVSGISLFVICLFIFKQSKKYFVLFVLLSIPICIYSFGYAMQFLDLNSSYYYEYDADRSYSKHSFDVLTGRMIFFPADIFNLWLGEGIEPIDSDIGYIKLIFMIGILGLLLILCSYLYNIFDLRKKMNFDNKEYNSIFWFIVAMFVCMLIFNCKLLLLYGRNFHDIFILTCFTLNKFLYEESKPQYR
jgi:hypothetical protein